jgi:hypothetical protein
VTWQLMIGKNLLWVAKQHGHSVQVMLTMYAAWLEGATEADIEAIKAAMQSRAKPTTSRLAVPEHAAPSNPPPPPEFGTRLALGKRRRVQASEKDQIIVAERVGLLGVPPRPFGAALRVLAPLRLVPSDHLGTRHNASLSTYPTGVIPPFALYRPTSGTGG